MTIRTAGREDAAGIARVHVEAWQIAYRGQVPDAFLDSLNQEKRGEFFREKLPQATGRFLVAEERGEVAGFCELVPSRDEDAAVGRVAEVVAIYVHPTHWRKGIGSALCQEAVEEAVRQGFQELTLWTLASNVPAKQFYEARGFKLDGAAKRFKLPMDIELEAIRYRMVL